jgi:CelD/BcsL family acetyltransferase involved in cellulose biosynthesis
MIDACERALSSAPPELLWGDEASTGLRLSSLRREWSSLHLASGASPFLAWDWLYFWWRRIAPDARPQVLLARDGANRLVGLLPLYERRERWAGIEGTRLGLMGDQHVGSDFMDAIALPGHEAAVRAHFVDRLARMAGRVDVVELLGLEKGNALGEALLSRLAGRLLVAEREPSFTCPLIELEGDYLSFLRAKGRADNLARRKKWLLAQPGFALERAAKPSEVAPALVEFFRLHALRWEKDGGSQGIESAAVRAFHRDACAALAESGRLRLHTLMLQGRALASVYGIVDRDRFYYYQSGYDPAWARRSVGLVLLGETLAEAFAEQRVAFEFLRGSEPYKFEWANAKREIEAVRLVARTPAGAAFVAARDGRAKLGAALRRLLGERAWQGVRRVRRRVSSRGSPHQGAAGGAAFGRSIRLGP